MRPLSTLSLNDPARVTLAIAEGSRCYSVAQLMLACVLLAAPLNGCQSSPKSIATTPPLKPAQFYPTRPTTPPPPFKLFHTTDNSITLVTAETATDDQIVSLIWQLHDAAHAHTFAQLHIPQAFIDKRDPIVFIHIYRGAKCAAEKYANGSPPCGGSYHAAGDYTLGSFAHKDRDDGVLLHDEDHQTELWNPDTPYTPQQEPR